MLPEYDIDSVRVFTVRPKRSVKIMYEHTIILDKEDYDTIIKYNIYSNTRNGISYGFYIKIQPIVYVSLGQYILDVVGKNMKVIHKNGNSHDFRKCNLFVGNYKLSSGDACELRRTDNRSSIYCGVSNTYKIPKVQRNYKKIPKYWVIRYNNKPIRFETELEAATEWGILNGFGGPVKRVDLPKYI